MLFEEKIDIALDRILLYIIVGSLYILAFIELVR